MEEESTTKTRLEQVRAERAKLEAERTARELARAESDKLAREERELADERAIAEAESAHGAVGKMIAVVETDLGVIILKRSNHLLYKKFAEANTYTFEACERLIRPCLVYPDRSRFDAIIEELPATVVRLANAVAELAGVRKQEVQGK